MNISLVNWIRNKLQENEEMHDYAVATDTVRCWIDEYNQLSQPAVSGRSEQLNCDHEWRVDTFDCFGFPAFKYCDKCCKREAV